MTKVKYYSIFFSSRNLHPCELHSMRRSNWLGLTFRASFYIRIFLNISYYNWELSSPSFNFWTEWDSLGFSANIVR